MVVTCHNWTKINSFAFYEVPLFVYILYWMYLHIVFVCFFCMEKRSLFIIYLFIYFCPIMTGDHHVTLLGTLEIWRPGYTYIY